MFRFSPRSNRAHLVKWREWGEEAFQEAVEQNKPVALFITAFWCGVCQRMDETSLSSDEVIALLNAFFVPVRVEESQRPDVDLRYNQNGWPTIAFLTPGGDHLFSVNHVAPKPFTDLLAQVVSFHRQVGGTVDRPAVRDDEEATGAAGGEDKGALGAPLVAEIAGMVEGLADPVHGGYGTEIKFLHTEANEFFLYLFESTGERAYLNHVMLTLDKMRESRTFDAKDGGFFRYSTKQDWREPHPEKLLDDQAALLRNYLHAYLLTEHEPHRETATRLIDYLDSTLSDGSNGAFWGCQDYVRPERRASTERSSGPPPLMSLIDTYVYCDANARTASAYLDAWWILGREECKERATRVLELLWEGFRGPNGGMYHYSDGVPHASGILMDTVMTGLALLDAYAVLHDSMYLQRAKQLAEHILRAHRNPAGGFFDICETGPASLQFPVTMLTQNAAVAAFFVRLADLSGDIHYRESAHWALWSFPNTHRQHEAFAGSFGHALSRLLALPLTVTVTGQAGSPGIRALARAALTRLGHQDLVLRFQEDDGRREPRAHFAIAGRPTGSIVDPASLTPELVMQLSGGMR